MAHSHTGKTNPTREAKKRPKNLFLGIILLIKLSGIRILIIDDTNAPRIMKGSASKTILKKIIAKLLILSE
jgi:hypothetical protein